MAGKYPERIKALPVQKWQVDTSSKYKLEAKNCDVLFASYQPGTSIPLHAHDDADVFGVITKGVIILTVDGKTTRHGVGEWYQIPPSAEHASVFEQETEEIEFWFKPNT